MRKKLAKSIQVFQGRVPSFRAAREHTRNPFPNSCRCRFISAGLVVLRSVPVSSVPSVPVSQCRSTTVQRGGAGVRDTSLARAPMPCLRGHGNQTCIVQTPERKTCAHLWPGWQLTRTSLVRNEVQPCRARRQADGSMRNILACLLYTSPSPRD